MAGEFCRRIGCFLADGHVGPCRFCRCGPNEACSKCSTPRPTPTGVFFGQRFAEDAPSNPYATTAEGAAKAAARRMEERHSRERAQPRLVPEMVGLDALLPMSPCAHQWLLLDGKAWCPNCDVVRAPPRDSDRERQEGFRQGVRKCMGTVAEYGDDEVRASDVHERLKRWLDEVG